MTNGTNQTTACSTSRCGLLSLADIHAWRLSVILPPTTAPMPPRWTEREREESRAVGRATTKSIHFIDQDDAAAEEEEETSQLRENMIHNHLVHYGNHLSMADKETSESRASRPSPDVLHHFQPADKPWASHVGPLNSPTQHKSRWQEARIVPIETSM